MKKYTYLLMALPLFIASCSSDEVAMPEECVEVKFCAELPMTAVTRATDLTSYKVYCAVYEQNGNEITNLREEVNVAGSQVYFSPRLVKGRTYDIAFWAAKDGAYNTTSLEAITRVAGLSQDDYDAFTGSTTITIDGNVSHDITLKRPHAQLNVGVTPTDWNVVVNTFGMTPTSITLDVDAYDTFDARTATAKGNNTTTYNLDVTGAEFTCEGETYKNIAQCYVLAGYNKQNINFSYSIYDQSSNAIREDVEIIHVPIERNYKTNVVGGLLTGVVTYSIAIDNSDLQGDNNHNHTIQ